MAKVVPAALGRLRLMLVATMERNVKKEQVYSRTFEGEPLQQCAMEQLFCFVGMHDTVDKLTIHSALATGLGVEIQSLEVQYYRAASVHLQIVTLLQVSISKLCTGEPEPVTWELPGKGPVAKVFATFTFRPTEGLDDAASDIERDSFGFEIAQLQRETYRAHKDLLRKISPDDKQRIEGLLETGLLVDRQQVQLVSTAWRREVAVKCSIACYSLLCASPCNDMRNRNGSVR
jgi:hypothetical protein